MTIRSIFPMAHPSVLHTNTHLNAFLVAHYPMGPADADIGGNLFNRGIGGYQSSGSVAPSATLGGTVAVQQAGGMGRGLRFNTGYAQLPSTLPMVSGASLSQWAFSCWIYVNNYNSDYCIPIYYGANANEQRILFYMINTTHVLTFDGFGGSVTFTGLIPATGQWNHLAVSLYDPSNTKSIIAWLNLSAVTGTAPNTTNLNSGVNFGIQRDVNGSNTYTSDVIIRDWRLYQTMFTTVDVCELYFAGRGALAGAGGPSGTQIPYRAGLETAVIAAQASTVKPYPFNLKAA